MDKCFATWINCTLLKILSISISLSQVAASYYFLDSSLSCVLCLSCSFWLTYVHGLFWTTLCLILGQKGGDILHLTCSWSWHCVLCFGYLICWSWSYCFVFVVIEHGYFDSWMLFWLMNAYWLSLGKWSLWIFVDICGYMWISMC